MTTYDKDKDLARILVEGTKAVYGPEKAEQVKTEFERQRKLPVYRGSAEELTAIVDRVFEGSVAEAQIVESPTVEAKTVESIDDLVQYKTKPSMVKVAAKGTWNLAKKLHVQDWYYPIIGFLPGRYQERIAKKYDDNPLHYTFSNAVLETLMVSGLVGSLSSVAAGVLFGFSSGMANAIRVAIAKDYNSAGSIVTTLPMYAVLFSIAAVRAVKNGIAGAYSSAYEEEKQQLQQKSVPLRIESKAITQTPVRVEEFVDTETVSDEEAKALSEAGKRSGKPLYYQEF